MSKTETRESPEVVYIVLKKSCKGPVYCDLCGTLTVKGHQRFEQWGSRVKVVAEQMPTYTCPNDGIVWMDPEANLEFLQKELSILRQRHDRGFIGTTVDAIKLANWHIRLLSLTETVK